MPLASPNPVPWDVIIVGAGPAGLSAALVLGRSCRRVLVFDSGHPRNAVSPAMHGFLSRDGMNPLDFLQTCRDQLTAYPDVHIVDDEVTACTREGDSGPFSVTTASGRTEHARFLLIATGIRDKLPEVDGFQNFYGHTAHHCPYCDGWEHRGQRIAVYGRGQAGADLALELKGWSPHITLCTDGDTRLTPKLRQCMKDADIPVIETRLSRLTGAGTKLEAVHFLDGRILPADAFFFVTAQRQTSPLACSLGCQLDSEQCIGVDIRQQSDIKGLFVAGNASKGPNMVIFAAAEGAHAALSINECLLGFAT